MVSQQHKQRRKHWSTIAVLAGALLVLTGLTSPVEAATARSARIAAAPAVGFVNSAVTFTGRVTKSPVGSIVKIQRKSGSSWVLARTTRTSNAAGAFTVKLNRPATGAVHQYRAVAPVTSKLKAATSPAIKVTALRHTAATLNATPRSIATGDPATLAATVTPYVAGSVVTLQYLSTSGWTFLTTAQLSSKGTFTRGVTPGATRSYRLVVPRAGINGTATSAPVTVRVGPAPVITSPATLPAAAKGVAYSQALTKTGGNGTWARTSGTLPPGVGLSTAGVLSGTPTSFGVRTFSITFIETSSGLTVTKAFTLTTTPAPTISTFALTPGTRGIAYSAPLVTTGVPGGTWSHIGPLPGGLTMNPTTGTISGYPTQPGDYAVYPVYTETNGRQAFRVIALHIGGEALKITTPTLPDGTRGSAYSVTLAQNGGTGTWSSLELPPGLTLNPDTGVLSGTPTTANTYPIWVGFTEDGSQAVATAGYSLIIKQTPQITTSALPDGTVSETYNQQLTSVGTAGSWTLTKGTLPPGLTLSPAGVISGKPTTAGDYGITVTFTETSTSFADSQPLLIHVSTVGAPVITTTTLPTGTIGQAYSGQLTAAPTGGTWTSSYASPPPGITLSSSGVLTGTPTTAGDWLFIVKYTQGGKSNTKVMVIRVVYPPTPG